MHPSRTLRVYPSIIPRMSVENDDGWLQKVAKDGQAREAFDAYQKELEAKEATTKEETTSWKKLVAEPVPHKGFKAVDDLAGYENTDEYHKWWQVPNPDEPLLKDTRGWHSCICAWRLVPMGVRGREWCVLEVRLNGGTSLRHIIFNAEVKGVLTKAVEQTEIEEVIIDLHLRNKGEQVKLRCWGSENALALHIALAKYLSNYYC